MCRDEALKACARVADMKAAGASRVVALVKEDLENEVADFRAFWSEEVFLDENRRFYTALGGGEAHKPYAGVAAFLATILNPFSKRRVKAADSAAKAKGVAGNLKGEGFTSGGVYVVRTDGKAAYSFLEEDLGDHAPVEDVVEAVRAAAKGEMFLLAPLSMPGSAEEPGACRKTWKEWAGRTTGPDGYTVGDVTRGIAASLKRAATRSGK
eukprot:gnl/TRDRNA2_/TRDRNA2_30312_c0_seq1.p1 gnl/TRDRNA2_/TRDRNA2_30312_c0~~gnl/TRDRNA2_/TRDRNA2_30312_c0_seq1.p1  ORF type:complete len:210 (+),score=37.86 gnl/TRDRNA2_/TRDRNA2_30312_c0_seq1:188-817(+)